MSTDSGAQSEVLFAYSEDAESQLENIRAIVLQGSIEYHKKNEREGNIDLDIQSRRLALIDLCTQHPEVVSTIDDYVITQMQRLRDSIYLSEREEAIVVHSTSMLRDEGESVKRKLQSEKIGELNWNHIINSHSRSFANKGFYTQRDGESVEFMEVSEVSIGFIDTERIIKYDKIKPAMDQEEEGMNPLSVAIHDIVLTLGFLVADRDEALRYLEKRGLNLKYEQKDAKKIVDIFFGEELTLGERLLNSLRGLTEKILAGFRRGDPKGEVAPSEIGIDLRSMSAQELLELRSRIEGELIMRGDLSPQMISRLANQQESTEEEIGQQHLNNRSSDPS